jgi:hypothetical protein
MMAREMSPPRERRHFSWNETGDLNVMFLFCSHVNSI